VSVLSIVEWVIWGIILACGLWFAIGIRIAAVRHAPPPLWPTLIMSFSLVFLPLIFPFLPFSKLHIIWILFILWQLSFMAGVGYIPIVSQLLIWPAYIYASILIMGTGVSLTSPSRKSPWAARDKTISLKYIVKGWFQGFSHKLSHEEKEQISKLMESRRTVTEQKNSTVAGEFSNPGKAGEKSEDTQMIGLELSRQLKESIGSIPGSLSIIENEGKGIVSLKDIDKKKLIRELTILTYVGQRLAIQLMQKKGSERDEIKRREICNSLDNYSSQFLENSPEFYDLLDQRGEQYFQLIQSYEEISHEFLDALQFKFEQFCLGWGGENEPLIVGGFLSKVPLYELAIQYWSNGFTETVKFLKTQEPL